MTNPGAQQTLSLTSLMQEQPFKIIDGRRDKVPPESWHKGKPYDYRPFIAWDGEGITYPGDIEQSYVLFGNSVGRRIIAHSLSTSDCFDLLLDAEKTTPEAIHIGFALQYDFNMMFKDLPLGALWCMYRTHKVKWNGYKIEYRPGKWLNLRKGDTTIRLFDVFGFFQSSFVTALGKYVGIDNDDYRMVVEGKKRRQQFNLAQLDSEIVPYWKAELRLMVQLMNSLRNDLMAADLRINSWHGPGAVANTVFRHFNVQGAKHECPTEVNRAAQYAYAGGRFELLQAGHYPNTVYEYDIRSAYPSAIQGLPSLADNSGRWQRVTEFDDSLFGVWRIQYRSKFRGANEWLAANPLFCRDAHGNVSYPSMVEGWYWTPEAALVREYILDGWVWIPTKDGKPFAFVQAMYDVRSEYKRQGNSAERALKLALNSLYGKMAQRTGWNEEGDPIPRWHQLEWAGYVTSATRAKIWNAIKQNPKAIIAIETDAVFSTKPLNLDVGEGLGQWELTTFENITYIQNGFYWATKDKTVVAKYRGVDSNSVLYEDALAYLHNLDQRIPFPLKGITTRFIGMGLGLHTKAVWRSWETACRDIHFGGGGKRQHTRRLCPACRLGITFSQGLHPLTIVTPGGRSEPHSLPWLAGAESELRKLDELERW